MLPMFGHTDAMEQMPQLRIGEVTLTLPFGLAPMERAYSCLLYTSDAADE